jgi:hypothetical protein
VSSVTAIKLSRSLSGVEVNNIRYRSHAGASLPLS